MKFFASFVLIGALVLSSATQAEPTREGAERIKPILQDIIDYQALMHSVEGGSLKTKGTVTVAPSGSFYASKLPALDMMSPDKTRTSVGSIMLNIIPDPRHDSLLGMSATVPVPIRNYNANNQLLSELHIRDQTFRGVYHHELMQFVILDARYSDIRLQDQAGKPSLIIPALTLKANMVEDDQKRWSGPLEITATNPSVTAGLQAGAHEASFRLTSVGLDPVRYKKALQEFQNQIATRLESKTTAQPDLSDVMLTFFKSALLTTASGVGYELALTKPVITLPGSAPMQAAAIKAAVLLQGLGQGAVTLDIKGNASDIDTPQTNIPFFPAPMPKDIILDGEVQRVPLDPFITLLTLQSEAAQMPQGAQAAFAAYALTQFPKLLSQSGMRLNLKNMALAHNDYELTLEGQLNADPGSVTGITGLLTMRLDGLDTLLAQQALRLKANPTDKSLRFGADILKLLKLAGKDDASHAQRLQYAIELVADGSIWINDQSLMSLWGKVRPITQ